MRYQPGSLSHRYDFLLYRFEAERCRSVQQHSDMSALFRFLLYRCEYDSRCRHVLTHVPQILRFSPVFRLLLRGYCHLQAEQADQQA